MRRAILVLLLASCSAPIDPAEPTETGAPLRVPGPEIQVTRVHADVSTLLHAGLLANSALLVQNGQKYCSIALPNPAQVSRGYYLRKEAHELAHCAGQTHVQRVTADGRFIIVWQP